MFGLWGLMEKQMPPNKQFLEILHVYDKKKMQAIDHFI